MQQQHNNKDSVTNLMLKQKTDKNKHPFHSSKKLHSGGGFKGHGSGANGNGNG